jgi:hypothetical protein
MPTNSKHVCQNPVRFKKNTYLKDLKDDKSPQLQHKQIESGLIGDFETADLTVVFSST